MDTRGKVIVGSVIAGVVLLLWTLADIFIFEDGSVYTTLPTQSLAVQRIEAVGEDFRVYEFPSKVYPEWHCIFAAAETKGGLFCFKPDNPVTLEAPVEQ